MMRGHGAGHGGRMGPLGGDQKRLDWELIRRLYTYTRPYAGTRNLLLLLVVVRALQLPLLSWTVARVISRPIARHDVVGTLWGVLGFVTLVVLTEIVFMFRVRIALRMGESISFDLRSQIYRHLLVLPMSFFNKMPLGRMISRVTSDVDVVRIGIQDVFFISTVQAGSMLIAAGVMLYYDWFLFLVVLTLVPVLWLTIRHFRDKLRQAHREVQESYSRVTASLAESIGGMRVIQSFVRQVYNDRQFGQQIVAHGGKNMEAARQGAVFVPMLEVNSQLFLAIVLVVGGYRALHGSIGLEPLIQFLFLSELFFGPIPVLGRQYNQALNAMAGAERVFRLLDRKPAWTDDSRAVDLPALQGRVEFRNVSFEYDPGKPALRRVSFEVEPGQTVALVGETGSGKSTLTRLLAKLYLPTRGEVMLDGQSITQITGSSLHRQLGMVPQDSFLLSGSVLDNIRFARPTASDEEVVAVARRLDIVGLIEELPDGFHTELGDKGANLSVGQRQLICFARALLADPRLLILDEATSSIDALTERRLQRALQKLLEGRTSVVVAHRLSTIKSADRILVLDHGRIVERGSHHELLAAGGRYTRLYREFVRSIDR